MNEFNFVGCFEIKELLGKRAEDEQELLELIEEVPDDSIYYHMHSYFLRHFYIAGAFPNDFATWAAVQVRDRVLGEKLAEVTPSGEKNLSGIRNELIEIIDNHLSEIRVVPSVVYGQQFYFMQSRIIEIPTSITVTSLQEFIKALKTIDASAIYNHTYEARVRDKLGRSDFAIWFDEVLNKKTLADKIEKLDSYMYSLEGLRLKIVEYCIEELEQ